MKIAVCLKRVPDTTAKIVIGATRTAIDEAGVKFVPNPYDEFALEAAIALKEQAGAGETTVIAVGTDASQETLRTALAMGIDRAVLLQSTGSADGLAVSRALAAELKAGGYDLILFGKLAVDDYNHQVGVMVAELLELPCISAAAKLDPDWQRDRGGAGNRRRGRGDGLFAAGGGDLRQGDQQPAAAVTQGDHGREEEATRDKASDARGRIVRDHQPGAPGRTPGGAHRRRRSPTPFRP